MRFDRGEIADPFCDCNSTVDKSKKAARPCQKKEDAMGFRINHLHLKTPDPKKTADFYVEYTGAKVVKENTRPDGSKNFRLDLHGVELNVTEFLTEQKLSQFNGLEHVAIDTNNFDGEVGKIKAAGVKILEERVLPDGRRVCFFEGPEGVRLEFLEWKQ
jgi:catechol 2,3-dioxygenase-like lactoylglutathione lyase family enzyme